MLAYIPLVYCFLPETAGRTLEQMDYLFASKSAFTWNEEREFEKRMAIFNANLATSERKSRETTGNRNVSTDDKVSIAMIDYV